MTMHSNNYLKTALLVRRLNSEAIAGLGTRTEARAPLSNPKTLQQSPSWDRDVSMHLRSCLRNAWGWG